MATYRPPRPGAAYLPGGKYYSKPIRKPLPGGGTYTFKPGGGSQQVVVRRPTKVGIGLGAGLRPGFPGGRSPLDIPGYNPDIRGGVESDWELQQAMSDITAANAADEASAKANIESLATGWGGDLSDLVRQGLISQQTADAAKANQFSAMSELGRQLETGVGKGQSQLAARGILSSGALPALTAELNRQYQRESTTGLQQLLKNIGEVRGNVARAAAQRQGGLAGVRAGIAQRLMGLQQYQPVPAMKAYWDPNLGSYVDDWGRRFNAQGQQTGYAP
jgi:hypothetical protein